MTRNQTHAETALARVICDIWTEQSQRTGKIPYVPDMLKNKSKRNDGDGHILKRKRLTT